jgi:hypothetical protein
MSTSSPKAAATETRTIKVTLSATDLQRLDTGARLTGRPRAEYAGLLIRKALDEGSAPGGLQETTRLDEILAPIHRGFEESGMSEEEVHQLLESELKEVRRERRQKRGA